SMVSYTTGGRFFITGSEPRIAQAIQDPQLAAYLGAHGGMKMTPATLTTDSWPYFYQHEPGLPVSVIVISVALVLLCWVLLRDRSEEHTSELQSRGHLVCRLLLEKK